jgi:anti-anti-sigma regulatory factor
MGIQDFSKDIVLITLPEQPQCGDELEVVNSMLCETVDRDVVIDFGQVQMLTSETLCGLMILDRLLGGAGHQLVLCNLSSAIHQVFVRTGLVTVFEFAEDQVAALGYLRSGHLSWAQSEPRFAR